MNQSHFHMLLTSDHLSREVGLIHPLTVRLLFHHCLKFPRAFWTAILVSTAQVNITAFWIWLCVFCLISWFSSAFAALFTLLTKCVLLCTTCWLQYFPSIFCYHRSATCLLHLCSINLLAWLLICSGPVHSFALWKHMQTWCSSQSWSLNLMHQRFRVSNQQNSLHNTFNIFLIMNM